MNKNERLSLFTTTARVLRQQGFWDWLPGALIAVGTAVLLGGLFYNMPPGRIE
jgi:hypothetical protein